MTSSLAGQLVLVTGGTGRIGGGAIHAFLAAGARVIAPVRNPTGITALRAKFSAAPHLDICVCDISDIAATRNLYDTIQTKYGAHALDHVVSCSGPWIDAPPFHQMPYEVYAASLVSHVNPHFALYTTFGKDVVDKPGATYTIVTGMATQGLLGFVATAQHNFASIVLGETKTMAGAVTELFIGMRVFSEEEIAAFSPVFPAVATGKFKAKSLPLTEMKQVEALRTQAGL